MPGSRDKPQIEDESVRHLVELGYVDPIEVAARDATRRRELEARLRKAVELHRQGHGVQAALSLECLVADDLDWFSPRQVLAEVYYSAGRWEEAQAQLDWLADHGVDHPRLALIAGGIAAARRDFHSALDDLQYARYAEPNLPSVHTLLGTVFFRLGRLDAAENAFRQAAEQNPTDARARDGVAAVCLKHGDYEDAADWALRSLEQDMQLFRAHYHLGVAVAHLNRPTEAVAALEAAARVDPARVAPYYWLSRIATQQLHDSAASAQYLQLARGIIRQRRAQRGRQ